MLKLSKKSDYALMAMKHLAKAPDRHTCSAKELAHSYHIPPEALAKILQRLVKARLLDSEQGAKGGYRLARSPNTISAFEVIRAIDGPLLITSCITVRGQCGQSECCTVREPLQKVNSRIESLLKGIMISELNQGIGENDSAAKDKASQLITIS